MRNKLAKLALTAALALATTLTLSCSDDGGGGADTIKKASITGLSQKGPFAKGTRATLYELNGKFTQTGNSFFDIIADDKGSFEIKGVELASPYALLEADGYYRNEVTGKTSAAPIKLYAIADIREKDNINVNLLTNLEYYRVLHLVETSGKTVAEAKGQAQKEILAVFGIDGEEGFASSEDMSIFGTSEGDAALLAISILLQGDLGEGDFSTRLTGFAQALKENGTWDNKAEKNKMAEWAFFPTLGEGAFCDYDKRHGNGENCHRMPTNDMCSSGMLVSHCSNVKKSMDYIKEGILNWNLSSEIPDFEKHIDNYWVTIWGLGKCSAENANEIKERFICRNSSWKIGAEYINDLDCWEQRTGEIVMFDDGSYHYVCKNN
jgi:hypothetical protein